MVNPKLGKRVLRRMGKNSTKLMAIFILVVTTSGLFIGYFVGTSSVLSSISHFNKTNQLEQGHFITDRIINDSRVEKMLYRDIVKGNQTLRVFKETTYLNYYQVTSGEGISSEKHILLDENYLQAHGWSLLDEIELVGESFEIIGTAISPDYVMTKKSELVLQPNPLAFGVAYVSEATFNKFFLDGSISYYAYSSGISLEEVIDKFNPTFIRDSMNNSRVQQVLGDAESPQQLSVLIVSIFFLITITLILIYFLEEKRKEEKNILTLSYLGFSKKEIINHYLVDILLVVNTALVVGIFLGHKSIPIVMEMNQTIYNYPILTINREMYVLAVILSFLLFNLLCLFVIRITFVRKAHRKSSKNHFTLAALPSKISFIYRYRIVKILRNKAEIILFILLIVVTGFLINFSFLLKSSVEEYVDNLEKDTLFTYLYQDNVEDSDSGESVKAYTLYDQEGITQNIFSIPQNSIFWDIQEDDVVITTAFASKYNYEVGDVIELENVLTKQWYSFEINRISSLTTVSEIYINEERFKHLEGKLPYTDYFASNQKLSTHDDGVTFISREEIISSGESILQIIRTQITLILVIAIIVEVVLMASLIKFIYEVNFISMKSLYLSGFSKKEIRTLHFGLNSILATIFTIITFMLGLIVVRVFLDSIMFTFTNYVQVTSTFSNFFITTSFILTIYLVFVCLFDKKLKRETFK